MSLPDDARTTCANCAAPLAGPFCALCGQKDLGTRVELRELVAEIISESFEIEGRLPRTIASVAALPGHYLGEFLKGRRRSFASPFRFYLVMVFVSALALGYAGDRLVVLMRDADLGLEDLDLKFNGQAVHVDSGRYAPAPAEPSWADCRPDLEILPWSPTCLQPERLDWLASMVVDPSVTSPEWDPSFEGRLSRALNHLVVERGLVNTTDVMLKMLLQQVPIVMSLLVLGHFLILRLLWWRQHSTVAAITALVTHTLLLVAVTALVVYPSVWFFLFLVAWHQLHVVIGLKAAYGSSWFRTLLGYMVSSLAWLMLAGMVTGVAARLALQRVVDTYAPLI